MQITCEAAEKATPCKYSLYQGTCEPENVCRVGACGLITCDCKRTPANQMFMWDALDLNFTSALNSAAIERAFQLKVRSLHPERNAACVRRASAEFLAAKRARDSLMALTELAVSSASIDPDMKHAFHEERKNMKKKKKKKGRGRIWLVHLGRGRSQGLRVSRQRKQSFGMTIPIFVLIKLALKKKIKGYLGQARTAALSWWQTAKHLVGKAIELPMLAAKAIAREASEHGTLVFVLMLSCVTIQAVLAPLA